VPPVLVLLMKLIRAVGYLQKGELAKAECITAELVVNLAATPPIVDNLFLQYYLGVGDLEKGKKPIFTHN
jgi:hypothetical protein